MRCRRRPTAVRPPVRFVRPGVRRFRQRRRHHCDLRCAGCNAGRPVACRSTRRRVRSSARRLRENVSRETCRGCSRACTRRRKAAGMLRRSRWVADRPDRADIRRSTCDELRHGVPPRCDVVQCEASIGGCGRAVAPAVSRETSAHPQVASAGLRQALAPHAGSVRCVASLDRAWLRPRASGVDSHAHQARAAPCRSTAGCRVRANELRHPLDLRHQPIAGPTPPREQLAPAARRQPRRRIRSSQAPGPDALGASAP